MSKTHVPAWKRLGLKLKYAKEENDAAQPNRHARFGNGDEPPSKKRRTNAEDTSPARTTNGSSDVASLTPSRSEKPKKQVSFSSDTKTTDGDSAISIIPSEVVEEVFQQADSKKKSKKQKLPTQPSTVKSQGTLEYLVQFYTSNSTWKFNKNREVWILKHALSTSDIPPSYNLMLAQYIHGLKSPNTRDRLRLECIGAGPGGSLPQEVIEHGARALASFPETLHPEESALAAEMQTVARPRLILWALDPSNEDTQPQPGQTQDSSATKAATKTERPQKKRKNRTAVVEYSSSSSSSSESSSDSETSSSDSDSD